MSQKLALLYISLLCNKADIVCHPFSIELYYILFEMLKLSAKFLILPACIYMCPRADKTVHVVTCMIL